MSLIGNNPRIYYLFLLSSSDSSFKSLDNIPTTSCLSKSGMRLESKNVIFALRARKYCSLNKDSRLQPLHKTNINRKNFPKVSPFYQNNHTQHKKHPTQI